MVLARIESDPGIGFRTARYVAVAKMAMAA
jgi:hypothetical protein